MHNIPGKGVCWLSVNLLMVFTKTIIVENLINISNGISIVQIATSLWTSNLFLFDLRAMDILILSSLLLLIL